MATVNYVTKYADAALEAFKVGSLTSVFDSKYDWTGAKTVTVFTNTTATMADYSRTGGFGTPTHIGNTKDDLLVNKDRSFNGLIDKMDMDETGATLAAGEWLGMQIRQVVVPEVDTYVLATIATACPSGQVTTGAVTSANAYTTFLNLNVKLDDAEVPVEGRVAFATAAYCNSLKLDANFVKASDLGMQTLINGQIGEIDGVPVIKVPSSRMPSGCVLIIAHRAAIACPVKLADGKIGQDALYSGWIVNGRFVYDAFLLDTLNAGIAKHTTS